MMVSCKLHVFQAPKLVPDNLPGTDNIEGDYVQ